MRQKQVASFIEEMQQNDTLTFQAKGGRIAHALDTCSEDELLDHLDYAGIIPESFGHGSTEEKLFAKYCDALLAQSWNALSIKSEVILERADAADVSGRMPSYSIVGDAKAFRLSRTAKNQKDFKVGALNSWRKGADYACLVGPLYQYPNTTSQIYVQAVEYNVTLLSYTHLAYLIRHRPSPPNSIEQLWQLPGTLAVDKSASSYWNAIASLVCQISGTTVDEWVAAVGTAYQRLPSQAEEQIRYWEDEKRRIHTLSHDETVEHLIDALKINGKISVIRKNSQNLAGP